MAGDTKHARLRSNDHGRVPSTKLLQVAISNCRGPPSANAAVSTHRVRERQRTCSSHHDFCLQYLLWPYQTQSFCRDLNTMSPSPPYCIVPVATAIRSKLTNLPRPSVSILPNPKLPNSSSTPCSFEAMCGINRQSTASPSASPCPPAYRPHHAHQSSLLMTGDATDA